MCLGIPGRIESIRTDAATGMRMGRVTFDGVSREVSLAFVPEAEAGAYVLVHVGFAISVLDEAEAKRTLAMFREMGMAEDAADEAAKARP